MIIHSNIADRGLFQVEGGIEARGRQHPSDIKYTRIDRLQMDALIGPQVHRPALGFAVQPDIGHRLQPYLQGRNEGGEVRQVLATEEMPFGTYPTARSTRPFSLPLATLQATTSKP